MRRVVKVVKKTTASGDVREHHVPVILAEVWLQPSRNGERPRSSRSRLFSIAKYGEDRALELAKAWRHQQGESLAQPGETVASVFGSAQQRR